MLNAKPYLVSVSPLKMCPVTGVKLRSAFIPVLVCCDQGAAEEAEIAALKCYRAEMLHPEKWEDEDFLVDIITCCGEFAYALPLGICYQSTDTAIDKECLSVQVEESTAAVVKEKLTTQPMLLRIVICLFYQIRGYASRLWNTA